MRSWSEGGATNVRQRTYGYEGKAARVMKQAPAHRGFLIQNTLQSVLLFVDKGGPAKRLWSDAQSNQCCSAVRGARRATQQMCAWMIAQKRCALADWHSSAKSIAALLITQIAKEVVFKATM